MGLLLPAVLLVLGLVVLWLAVRQRASAGLPDGRPVYVDAIALRRTSRSLYDPACDLAGRPDYLLKQGKTLVPVELKSGRAPSIPHLGHVLQLAAYCLLVQTCHGERPAYGVLKYEDRSFAIDYTSSLENRLLDVLAEMRRAERRKEAPRSHHSPARCSACGYQERCDQRLN